MTGDDRDRALERILRIEVVLDEIVDHAAAAGTTPHAAAVELAAKRIAAASPHPHAAPAAQAA